MKRNFVVFLAFAAVVAVNVYFRAFPAYFPQLKRSGMENALQEKFTEVARKVEESYGAIPSNAKGQLIDEAFARYRKTEQGAIEKRAQELYLKEKDRWQDSKGQTYLMELDCWHWMRYVRNVLTLGHPGDVVRNGKQIDTLMDYPDGMEIPWPHFLFYMSAWSYKAILTVLPSLPLETFLFYQPLFLSVALIAALFFICARFFGVICALVGCLFVGMAPIFMPRSVAGWFDMDVLNLLLPLLAVGSYLFSYDKNGWRKLPYLALAAFWIGLFAATWTYWFVFAAIIVAFEAYSILNLWLQKLQYKDDVAAEMRSHALSLAVFSACSLGFVLLMAGVAPLQELYRLVFGSLSLNDVTISVWPNVYSTVGELKRPDFMTVARSSGDVLLFSISLAAMLYLLLTSQGMSRLKRASVFMFVIWFMAVFFICSKGVRFVVFLLIPCGVMLGWGIEEFLAFCEDTKNWIGMGAAVLLLAYSCYATVTIGYKAASASVPLMDDDWYTFLTTIKKTTPPGSVLNSWWDFGDWFKVVAQRPVIFDGQSQEGPRAYWMGRALITDNESEAVTTLRMLNNGGNRAFEVMDGWIRDPFRSLALLRGLVASDRVAAREKLSGLLPPAEAAQVEALLFDTPKAKAYFIVDESMVMKMPAISFIGNWDSSRVYLAKNVYRRSTGEIAAYLAQLGINGTAAEQLVKEAALLSEKDRPGWVTRNLFFYGTSPMGVDDDGLVLFDNGSAYRPATRKFYFYDSRERSYRIPRSIFITENDREEEVALPDANMETSVVIAKKDGKYEMMVLSTELAKSMFFRLNFLHGRGLSHFKLFSAAGGGTAQAYEVIW